MMAAEFFLKRQGRYICFARLIYYEIQSQTMCFVCVCHHKPMWNRKSQLAL